MDVVLGLCVHTFPIVNLDHTELKLMEAGREVNLLAIR